MSDERAAATLRMDHAATLARVKGQSLKDDLQLIDKHFGPLLLPRDATPAEVKIEALKQLELQQWMDLRTLETFDLLDTPVLDIDDLIRAPAKIPHRN
jgi:hypothetical protein